MNFGDKRWMGNQNKLAVIPERIRDARVYRGFTQKELAEEIGITKQAICNYEKGLNHPTNDVLVKMMEALKFPLIFFYKPTVKNVEQGEVYFRSSALPAKKKEMLEQKLNYLSTEIIGFIEGFIKLPDVNLIMTEYQETYSKEDIVEIAHKLRNLWGIDSRPIKNLTYIMQENGCIVARLKLDSEKTDGYSKWMFNRPYTFLNAEKNGAVRARFTLAHELGHIILHRKLKNDEDIKRREWEANFFAGELLFPSEKVLDEIMYVSLDSLIPLKSKWGVSIGVLVRRCLDLELITDDRFTMLQKQISKRKWRKCEPLDDILEVEQPRLFKEAFDLLDENRIVSKAEIPDMIYFDEKELIDLCCLENDYFNEFSTPNKPKLTLIK